MSASDIYSQRLRELSAEGRLRSIPTLREGSVDLRSNDYLGLGERSAEFRTEFRRRFPDAAMSASASRLLSRHQGVEADYESLLASLYGREALLFNSGYHANTGCVSALSLPGTLIVADKLMHASFIDGLAIGRSRFSRFRHNDLDHLRRVIEKEGQGYDRIIVAVESVYSMDGDRAPLDGLVELRRSDPRIMLYVDEAHAFGVEGERGLGCCEAAGIVGDTDIIIVTLGKAAGSQGAFTLTSPDLKEYLLNTARSFIFSTALPPASVAWSMLMTEKILGMDEERKHLHRLSARFAQRMREATGVGTGSDTQIQPLPVGDARRAVALSQKLADAGFDALAIRRPTVPPGGERIRFSLNARLDAERLEPLFDTLAKEYNKV